MSAQRNATVRRNKNAFGTMMSAKQPAFSGSFSVSKISKKQPPKDNVADEEKHGDAIASPTTDGSVHDLPLKLDIPILGLPEKPDVTMAEIDDFSPTPLADINADSLPKKPVFGSTSPGLNPYVATSTIKKWEKKPSAGSIRSAKRKLAAADAGWAGGWSDTQEEDRDKKRIRWSEDSDQTDDDEETKQAKAIERNKNRRGGGRGRHALPKKPHKAADKNTEVKTPIDIVKSLPLKTAIDLVTDNLIAKMNGQLPEKPAPAPAPAPLVVHGLPPRPLTMAKFKKAHAAPRSYF